MADLNQQEAVHGLKVLQSMTPEQYTRLRGEMRRAIQNAVQHAKRSLLEHLEFHAEMVTTGKYTPQQFARVLEIAVKRCHNDVSLIRDQILAALAIYESGGFIPPFGRSEEERERANAAHERSRTRQDAADS